MAGATPNDWRRWGSVVLGDVLPIVTDPAVAGFDRERDGKRPSVVAVSGFVQGLAAWQAKATTQAQLDQWSADARLSIGLRMRAIRALDVDVAEPAAANRIVDAIYSRLGATLPRRYRDGTGSCALLYRIADPPAVLRKGIVWMDGGKVEFLGDGQQLLVAGWHAKSSQRLQWEREPSTLGDVPAYSMQVIYELYLHLRDLFGTAEAKTRKWGYEGTLIQRAVGATVDPNDVFSVWLRDHGYVLGTHADGRVFVDCPWCKELPGTTAIQYDSACYLPPGARGAVEAGYSCFHGRHERKTLADYQEVLGYRAELLREELPAITPAAKPVPADTRPRFTLTRKGEVEATLDNVMRMLEWRDGFEIEYRYDAFLACVMQRQLPDGKFRAINDEDITRARLRLIRCGMESKTSDKETRRAIHLIAAEREMDSAQEWLAAKHWDGKDRFHDFITRCLKLPTSAYHTATARYIWTALAGRVIEPGVKADMVPVFIGAQGQYKSTLVASLAPSPAQFTVVTLENLDRREEDVVRVTRGVLTAEWAELKGLQTREADTIKGWISKQDDRWVQKYKEFAVTVPRRFVLFGTTNRTQFLSDPTGHRRWLPLHVHAQKVDLDWMAANRDQLWAQGAQVFRRSGVAWEAAEVLARAEHAKYLRWDVWRKPVQSWLAGQAQTKHAFSTNEILQNAVGLTTAAQGPQATHRMRELMLMLGWNEGLDGLWQFDLT